MVSVAISLFVVAAPTAGCAPTTAALATPASAAASADNGGQGAAATDFTLKDLDGQTVRLSDYNGKVVLIDFWATWCVPCQAELPHLQELYEKEKDKGFVVLGISMDGPETLASVPSIINPYHITFPILLDEETKVVGIYNPKRTAPLSILIDRNGKIVRVRQGYNPGDEGQIAADVTKALGS